MPVRNFMTASQLIGKNVVNSQDEDIGKIKDLVLNLATGKIAYAVLSFGGFLGMGDKLFAIPFCFMKINPEKDFVVLDIEKSKLINAPGFDKQDWPDLNDSNWAKSIEKYYVVCLQQVESEELL
ncbi:MAG: PRC-barrel [Gammaproteobacteria bacterium]|jgi:sporulation protein YlmC with PRC-barrel domain|nr:PRC-barrel [Gammaproteobacteria bacterium]